MKKSILIFIVIVIVLLAALFSAEKHTSRPSFCGSCHIMQPYFKSWENSKHGNADIDCVDCHYAPGEHRTIKAKFKGLGQLFSYLAVGDTEVRKPAIVSDLSCTTAKCHPTTGKGKEGEYWTKKISFVDYVRGDGSKAAVSLTHEAHYDKTKWVPGQELHCSTCHMHESGKKHIEVSPYTCYLCHFNKTELNENRAKCSLCHSIPEEPFKKSDNPDEKSVTHKVLEEREVPCSSCHIQLFKGDGMINDERCLFCHQYSEGILDDAKNMKLMHEKHVAAQAANCFNCHTRIEHKKGLEGFNYVDAVLGNCSECHAEAHMYQRLLLAGEGGRGVNQPYPIKHHTVNTNCMACHVKDSFDEKGRKIKAAKPETCVACHTEREGKLIKKWKADLADILEEARDIEQEAVDAIEVAKGTVPDEKLQKAISLLAEGQENIKIVLAGGGIHNKKYAVLLLDIAIEKFDDAMAALD